MAKIPEPKNSIVSKIDLYHEEVAEPPRGHMGCSEIGHHCERWLWYKFRWSVVEKFPGRVLRMFRRGRNEEEIVVADLRAAGLHVVSVGNSQSRVKFDWHVSGSVDGIIEYGVPEAFQKRHVLEIKTHSLKSFEDMEKHGVEKSKPQHYTQVQLYMLGLKIDRALYVAVCKDDDRIYTERIRFDEAHAQRALAKGQRIVRTPEIPTPISTNPSWYQCKWCPAQNMCHGKQPTAEVNCRTCVHGITLQDGTWFCERHQEGNIPLEYQREGCNGHVLHPDLVPWKLDGEAADTNDAIYIINGKKVRNGAGGYSSREILANPDLCAEDNEFIGRLRSDFDGKITG